MKIMIAFAGAALFLAGCAGLNPHTHVPHHAPIGAITTTKLPMGAPCTGCDACASDECVGWCTTLCNHNADCASGFACLGHTCYVKCANDAARCTQYDGASCASQMTADGTPAMLCGW